MDTYICSATRTPIGAFQGTLKSISATELGSTVIKDSIEKSSLDFNNVDEVIMGNVLSANLGQAPARQAALGAGLPKNVECMTINKVCGSGLKAVMLADQAIKTYAADVVVAGGMESMSRAPHYIENSRKGIIFGHSQLIDSILKDGLWDPYNNVAMGNCGETLCKENKYTLDMQNSFAVESYKRSKAAIDKGFFNEEIVSVNVKNRSKDILFDTDEEPLRFNKEKLMKLKPVFEKDGTITAGNASSLSDGAAALVLVSEEKVNELNLQPMARIVGHTSFATDPVYFTKAPIFSIKKLLTKLEMDINKIDLFEINEAFSCVTMAAMEELQISHEKVNINGGAVSMGHPIGASGARILVTLLYALKARNLKYGVASLCIGGGEASSVLVEMI